MGPTVTMKHVRRNCLECSGGTAKAVNWCPVFDCEFWQFRLGRNPDTIIARYGDRLLTPSKMPPHHVELELLPAPLADASLNEINVEGYYQPAVERPKYDKPKPSQAALDALRRLHERGRDE